jgi:predicted Zn-dependent protease
MCVWLRLSGRRHCALGAVIFGFVLSGCVHEPSAVTGERRAYGFSWQQELQLGEQSDAQIIEQMGLYQDEEIQRFVSEVGQRVLAMSDFRTDEAHEMYRQTEFNFRVLDSPVVNAFALPGGYIYVTRGLLTHMQNEAQLAVVLGHEVGHVVARHASQQALRSQWGQIGLFAGAILGQQVLGRDGSNVAGNILELGGGALQLLMFRYSREAEHESDELGVRYSAQAGYAAEEGVEFFRTLERKSAQEGGRALPSWSSTHPDPGERARRVRELSARHTAPGSLPVVNENDYLRRLEGMVLGENPQEGFQRGDWFLHPALAFQFPVPTGWRLQNERAIVIMAEPNGHALMGFEIVPAQSAREAAARLGQQQGVQVIGGRETVINGLPAAVVQAQAQSQQGVVGIVATFVEYQQRVYSFLGYAPAQIFPQVAPVLERVAAGFSPLTDPAVLGLQPARIQISPTPREMTFRELVPAQLPMGMTAEDLAIVNQVELDERLPAGRMIKLPR